MDPMSFLQMLWLMWTGGLVIMLGIGLKSFLLYAATFINLAFLLAGGMSIGTWIVIAVVYALAFLWGRLEGEYR